MPDYKFLMYVLFKLINLFSIFLNLNKSKNSQNKIQIITIKKNQWQIVQSAKFKTSTSTL